MKVKSKVWSGGKIMQEGRKEGKKTEKGGREHSGKEM